MIQIYSEEIEKILENKEKLEKELKVKIENQEKDILIEGPADKEFIAEKVIDAINFGFPIKHALLIDKGELIFEKINIKEHARTTNIQRVKGRIIGKQGKTIKTLSILTDCFFEIKDNEIGIIGAPERLKTTQQALISLIKGSKQANVYSFLEKHQPQSIFDFGLKEIKKSHKHSMSGKIYKET